MSVLCRKSHAWPPGTAVLAALFILTLLGCAAAVSDGGTALPADSAKSKLDPGLAREIGSSGEKREPARMLAVLIRTAEKIGQTERSAIEKEGCTIGSVTGDIVTATVPADRVEGLARLPFVVYIEKAKTLRPRTNPRP